MKKILSILAVCICISLSINTTHGGLNLLDDLERISENDISYSDIQDLLEDLAYAKVFGEDYAKIEADVKSTIKSILDDIDAGGRIEYMGEITYTFERYKDNKITEEEIFSELNLGEYIDTRKILKELGYNSQNLDFEREIDSYTNLFEKTHYLENVNLEVNDEIDGIYFGYTFSEHSDDQEFDPFFDDIDLFEEIRLPSIYSSSSESSITLEKVDVTNLSLGKTINVFDYVDELESDTYYIFQYQYYIKKGDYYIQLLDYSEGHEFNLDKYTVLSSFQSTYNNEIGRSRYSRDFDSEELALYRPTFERFFKKYQSTLSSEEYNTLLLKLKEKVLAYTKNGQSRYDMITNDVKDEESYEKAYVQYKKEALKEEILKSLLYFIHTENVKGNIGTSVEDLVK